MRFNLFVSRPDMSRRNSGPITHPFSLTFNVETSRFEISSPTKGIDLSSLVDLVVDPASRILYTYTRNGNLADVSMSNPISQSYLSSIGFLPILSYESLTSFKLRNTNAEWTDVDDVLVIYLFWLTSNIRYVSEFLGRTERECKERQMLHYGRIYSMLEFYCFSTYQVTGRINPAQWTVSIKRFTAFPQLLDKPFPKLNLALFRHVNMKMSTLESSIFYLNILFPWSSNLIETGEMRLVIYLAIGSQSLSYSSNIRGLEDDFLIVISEQLRLAWLSKNTDLLESIGKQGTYDNLWSQYCKDRPKVCGLFDVLKLYSTILFFAVYERIKEEE